MSDPDTYRVWGDLTREQMDARNAAILELWAMGVSQREIAERFDLTAARISQIVNSFGGR